MSDKIKIKVADFFVKYTLPNIIDNGAVVLERGDYRALRDTLQEIVEVCKRYQEVYREAESNQRRIKFLNDTPQNE